jgi:hypothetical protein
MRYLLLLIVFSLMSEFSFSQSNIIYPNIIYSPAISENYKFAASNVINLNRQTLNYLLELEYPSNNSVCTNLGAQIFSSESNIDFTLALRRKYFPSSTDGSSIWQEDRGFIANSINEYAIRINANLFYYGVFATRDNQTYVQVSGRFFRCDINELPAKLDEEARLISESRVELARLARERQEEQARQAEIERQERARQADIARQRRITNTRQVSCNTMIDGLNANEARMYINYPFDEPLRLVDYVNEIDVSFGTPRVRFSV